MANWNQQRYESEEPATVMSSHISGGHFVSCFVPHGVGLTMRMSRSGPQGFTLIPPTPPGAPPTSQLRQVPSSGEAVPSGSSHSWGSFGGESLSTPQRSQESQRTSFGTNSSGFINHSPGGGFAWTLSSESSLGESGSGRSFDSSTTPVPETPPSSNQLRSQQSLDWERRCLHSSPGLASDPLFSSTMLQTPPSFAPRPRFGAPPPGPSKRPQSSLSRASTLVLSPIPPSGSEPHPLRLSPLGGDSSFSGIERASPGSNRSFGGPSPPMAQQLSPASSKVSFGSSSSYITLEASMPPFPFGGSEAEKAAWYREYYRRIAEEEEMRQAY